MSGDVVLPDVVGRITAAIASEIRDETQPMSNWASKIGHPCKRYLVYRRVDWRHIPPITPKKKMLFDLGNVFEKHVAKVYLEKAGFEIVEQQTAVQSERTGLLERVKLHGKLDFICLDPKTGFRFPVEAKGVHPNTWEKVSSIEDMLFAKHYWTRQYPGQLMVYLLGREYEYGMFLMINKQTAEPKAIWLNLDYTYAEELVKKAEEINAHIAAGTYPDRIPYDEGVCGKCEFAPICLDSVMRTEAEILDDPDLIFDLEEREDLRPKHQRYDELDKSVKKRLAGIEKGIAGDFVVMGKSIHRDGYSVEAKDYWKCDIRKLGGGPNGE
jgi:CRISPR/Cas system-associated exonuclease Cas4 (RecB family)